MTIARNNKNFVYLEETKNLTKNEMKIKQHKENKSSKVGNQNFEDLSYGKINLDNVSVERVDSKLFVDNMKSNR